MSWRKLEIFLKPTKMGSESLNNLSGSGFNKAVKRIVVVV